MTLLTGLTLILFAAKVFGVVAWPWWVVLLPFLCGIAGLIVVILSGFVLLLIKGE